MHLSKQISSALLISIILLLFACGSAPKKNLEQIVSDAVTQPDLSNIDQTDESSAEFYIRTAVKNEGLVSKQYLIKAAELLYARGYISTPDGTSAKPESPQAQGNYRIQIQLIAARIALASNTPLLAFELLPDNENLSLQLLSETNALRAQALLKMGHFFDAIRIQIESEQLTETEAEKETINQSIWSTLSSLPTITIENNNDPDLTLKGWIDLAFIMRNAQSDITWLQEDILDWGTQYPLHPVSNTFIDQLLNEYLVDYSKFNNIAVFLPKSGKYQTLAEVVSNGFLSAYYEHNKDSIKPNIRFYDTSDENINIDALYALAVKDGADAIIGPMEKSLVNQMVQKKEFNIPILTLNYASDPENAPTNLFQFGLLPEDEAKHVAELAILQNKRNAAVLVPDSDWGKRIANAFQAHYELLGGDVLSQQKYTTGVSDFSKPIQAMLNLNDSNARHKRLKRLLKTDLKFTPQRRQDIDMIFIAATHRAARGIMPALKFHHASNIQTYATSHVYTGHIDKAADRDLNGVIFCDIPWTIVSKNKLKKTFKDNWKNKGEYTRLYALGIDAYDLIHNLKYLKKHNGAYFSGETGNITIDENNRLHRKLVWAKFIRGKPVYIQPSITPVGSRDASNNS